MTTHQNAVKRPSSSPLQTSSLPRWQGVQPYVGLECAEGSSLTGPQPRQAEGVGSCSFCDLCRSVHGSAHAQLPRSRCFTLAERFRPAEVRHRVEERNIFPLFYVFKYIELCWYMCFLKFCSRSRSCRPQELTWERRLR